jgi:ABC-type multidrug transport system fused ATPase/permease subunit
MSPSAGEDFKLKAVNLASAWVCVLFVLVFMVIYLIDHQYSGASSTPRAAHSRHHSRNSSLNMMISSLAHSIHHERSASMTVSYSITDRLRNFKRQLEAPNAAVLHSLTISNFVLSAIYQLCFALQLTPGFGEYLLRWFSSLNISLYALTKFVCTAFFILRIQVTFKQYRTQPPLIISLWLLNLSAFVCIFASLCSNPPYVMVISKDAGFVLTIAFIILDGTANLILLFLLNSALGKKMKKIKASQSSMQAQLPSEMIAEQKRIDAVENIIRIAMVTCLIAVMVTEFSNISYCFAFYIHPEKVSIGRINLWRDVYNWGCYVEVLFCSLSPVYNYSRFKKMWMLPALFEPKIIPIDQQGPTAPKKLETKKSSPQAHEI